MSRLDEIFSHLTPCEVLADVGCDHGYLAQKALRNGVCKRVIISDISAPSLQKAINLLTPFAKEDRVISLVSDGFKGYAVTPNQAIIAGMGGEEIIKILISSPFIVERLILQPMKNVDKLRVYLTENGYKIITDYVFKDGKFYDLIVCERGKDNLTQNEITFGRTNLIERGSAFIERLKKEEKRITLLLPKLSGEIKKENECNLSLIRDMIGN